MVIMYCSSLRAGYRTVPRVLYTPYLPYAVHTRSIPSRTRRSQPTPSRAASSNLAQCPPSSLRRQFSARGGPHSTGCAARVPARRSHWRRRRGEARRSRPSRGGRAARGRRRRRRCAWRATGTGCRCTTRGSWTTGRSSTAAASAGRRCRSWSGRGR